MFVQFFKDKTKIVLVGLKRNMDKQEFSNSSGDMPPTSNGVRDVLESLRTIFVAAIALAISIAEWVSHRFTKWQANAEEQARTLEAIRLEEQSILDQQRRKEEQSIRTEKRKAEEEAKIAAERREEERTIREEERKAKEQQLSPRKIIYPTLSAMSTVALIIGVAQLAPIAKWTKSQNECIAKTYTNEANSPIDFANKVMRCNGGHD